ncbi:hypothetical protein [Cupriavidus pauculus]|uniref:hypothetical protein n=1 Tax=Cupriavidus pauculus TaxID=82633 RepID=UPI001EE36B0E|nr:hypothetical protein [Cupriavidus pauculus]GJG97170.1 hypothetical protein CBA19C6_21795 [Cupriavidus pauculus]
MRFSLAGLAAAALLATSVAHAAPAAPAAPAANANNAAAAAAAAAVDGKDRFSTMLDTLEIGSPLPALPDCADHRTPDGKDVTAYCVELRGDGVMRQVGVPRDRRPVFMDGPRLIAVVDGNALVGVIVPTDGIRSQDAAAQSLNARYGKPFRQEMVDMKDKAGKGVKSIHAGWMRKPLTVELYSIPEDPAEGTIEMLLPQARALMANRDAEVAKSLAPPPASGAAAKGAKSDKAEKTDKADKKAPAKPVNPGSW